MSLGVALAGGAMMVGYGRSPRLTDSINLLDDCGILEKDEEVREICCNGSLTNCAISGVEIIVRAVETSKQCFKVSSRSY
jgi:hypothetical protein